MEISILYLRTYVMIDPLLQADKIVFSHSVTKSEYDALCFKYKAALLPRLSHQPVLQLS